MKTAGARAWTNAFARWSDTALCIGRDRRSTLNSIAAAFAASTAAPAALGHISRALREWHLRKTGRRVQVRRVRLGGRPVRIVRRVSLRGGAGATEASCEPPSFFWMDNRLTLDGGLCALAEIADAYAADARAAGDAQAAAPSRQHLSKALRKWYLSRTGKPLRVVRLRIASKPTRLVIGLSLRLQEKTPGPSQGGGRAEVRHC